ncbi:MAG: hypothetical protein PHU25_12230 [Deltaproteobacteria bacterium]|nr:hypothetical protein [Deltaproteobacteria bacterium]
MLVVADTIPEILARPGRLVGFYGVPPREALKEAADRHGADLVDLDIDYGAPVSRVVPDAYCHIIRNCVDNAAALAPKLACIVAATGPEKCDGGRYAARLMRDRLEIEVIATVNAGSDATGPTLLSDATGPLKKRVVRIMRAIVEPLTVREEDEARASRVEPTVGFWGTPPHPIGLLDLFPDTTQVLGWTRCVEQGRPADMDLETFVPDGLPVVFFSQGFCQKAALARSLAERHRGMPVDVHDSVSAATRAKVEAFIRLACTGGTP